MPLPPFFVTEYRTRTAVYSFDTAVVARCLLSTRLHAVYETKGPKHADADGFIAWL